MGRPDHATLDLASLQSVGVRLVGRLNAIDGRRVSFGTDLRATIAAADERMRRVLDRIDDGIDRLGLGSEVLPPERATRVELEDVPESIDLARDAITSVVWATGYTRRYGWLDLPLLDTAGEIRQRRGVTPVAGAYVLGQRFQHYRNSNFIDGVGRDAEFVADHICRRYTAPNARPSIRSRQS